MLNRLATNIARVNGRSGMTGEIFDMRQEARHGARWLIAAFACALAVAPAAAQDASEDASGNAAAAPSENITDTAPPVADAPLTPDESAALGQALLFDPADFTSAKPAKPLRLPRLNDLNKFDVSHTDKPDGSSTMVLKQPLASEWDAKIGADLNLAATPSDGYRPSRSLPAPADEQGSGTAWASVGVPNFATVDARVDPRNDQGKLGTTFKQSIPVGSKFAVTLQDSYSVTETFSASAPAPSDVPLMTVPVATTAAPPTPQIWGSQKTVKFDILATGTTFGAGVTTASNDPVTHNKLSAEQKLFGPLHVTTAVSDFGQPTTSKSIAAGLKLHW